MSRSPSRKTAKKTAKKKVGVKRRPSNSKKTDAASTLEEFDAWAESQKQNSTCHTCLQTSANATIRGLLESCIRNRAYKFSIQGLRNKILEKHPEAGIGTRGLERHLRVCVRDLYFRARGRRNG